jgi:hypothetical protein
LHQGNKIIVGSLTDSSEREVRIPAPAEGGSWRSVDHTGHSLILCSTRNEYAIFPLGSDIETSAASTFFLQDPSDKQDQSAVYSSAATFDADRSIYWIAIWARASLLAIKISKTDQQAFAAYAEIAIGSTSDLAIDLSDQTVDASLVYRRPGGFSMLTLHPSVTKELGEVADLVASRRSVSTAEASTKQEEQANPEIEEEHASEPTKEEIETTPASPVIKEAPIAKDVTVNLPQPITSPVQANANVTSAPEEIDYSKVRSILTETTNPADWVLYGRWRASLLRPSLNL